MTELYWSWDDIDIERCWDEIWNLWYSEGLKNKVISNTVPKGVQGIKEGEEVDDAQMSWRSLHSRWEELSQWAE